jgi:hypothetical protein
MIAGLAGVMMAGPSFSLGGSPYPIVNPPFPWVTTATISTNNAMFIGIGTVSNSITFQYGTAQTYPGANGATDITAPLYQGDGVSAKQLSKGPSVGLADLQFIGNVDLEVVWTFGSNLTNTADSKATLPTEFEMWHVGTWDLTHPSPYPSTRTYVLYKGAQANTSAPNGFGTYGYYPANNTAYEYCKYQSGLQGLLGEAWVQGRMTRNGLADEPGLYTQPSPLTVTVSAYQ